jgi:hypothetical protein
MHSIYDFIVKPVDSRYNNKIKLNGGKELIINSSIEDHKHVSRNAYVESIPLEFETEVQPGDEVIIHHNVFRRFYNAKGVEVNSRSFLTEDLYLVSPDQLYMYKREGKWKAADGFCFVKPIIKADSLILGYEKEEELVGILKYGNSFLESLGFNEGDVIGFTPDSEFEFVIDGERLYRMTNNSIIIKYGHEGNKEEYNPRWASSCGRVNQGS